MTMINTANIGSFGKTKAYLFADFSELLVLAQQYEELSRSNLADLLNDEIIEEDEPEAIDTHESDGLIIAHSGSARISGYVQDCFDHFDYRKAALKNFYPYELSNDLLSLKPDRTLEQLLYFFLLCCSQLGRFNASDGIRQRCATTFTKLCAEALKSLLSPAAKVYVFDANSDDRRTTFGTDARKALIKLVEEYLYETPIKDSINKEESASGDFGIDLVGVYPFTSDAASGRFVILGQCAARKEGWEDKTLEASPLALRSLIHFNHDPANLMFIPLLFRAIDGRWFSDRPLGGCVVIDRLRILHCISSRQLPDSLKEEISHRITELGFKQMGENSL